MGNVNITFNNGTGDHAALMAEASFVDLKPGIPLVCGEPAFTSAPKFGPPRIGEFVEFIRDNVHYTGFLFNVRDGVAQVAVTAAPTVFAVDIGACAPVRPAPTYYPS
jgi:hypothetical protein